MWLLRHGWTIRDDGTLLDLDGNEVDPEEEKLAVVTGVVPLSCVEVWSRRYYRFEASEVHVSPAHIPRSLGFETLMIVCEHIPKAFFDEMRVVCKDSEHKINRRVTHVQDGWLIPQFSSFVMTKLPHLKSMQISNHHCIDDFISQESFCAMLRALPWLETLYFVGIDLETWLLPYFEDNGAVDMYFKGGGGTSLKCIDVNDERYSLALEVVPFMKQLYMRAEEWSATYGVTVKAGEDWYRYFYTRPDGEGAVEIALWRHVIPILSEDGIGVDFLERYTVSGSFELRLRYLDLYDTGLDDDDGVRLVSILKRCSFVRYLNVGSNELGINFARDFTDCASLSWPEVDALGLYDAFDTDVSAVCMDIILAGRWPTVEMLIVGDDTWPTAEWLIASRDTWPSLCAVFYSNRKYTWWKKYSSTEDKYTVVEDGAGRSVKLFHR